MDQTVSIAELERTGQNKYVTGGIVLHFFLFVSPSPHRRRSERMHNSVSGVYERLISVIRLARNRQ